MKKKLIPLFLLLVIAVNLLINLIHINRNIDLPWPIPQLQIDGGSYLIGVKSIIENGNLFYVKDLYHSPGFQIYLAPFFLSSSAIALYKLANFTLVLLSFLLFYKFIIRIDGKATALITLVCLSFSAQIDSYSNLLQPEILMMFLFSLLAFLATKPVTSKLEKCTIGFGAFFLVLIQVRFFPIIFLLLYLTRANFKENKIILLSFFLPSVLWCGLQSYFKHKFIFFSEGSSIRYLVAYNPNATGASFPYPPIIEPSGIKFIFSHIDQVVKLIFNRYFFLWNLKQDLWDLGNPFFFRFKEGIIHSSYDWILHFAYFFIFHLTLLRIFIKRKIYNPSLSPVLLLIIVNFIGPVLIFGSSRFFLPSIGLSTFVSIYGIKNLYLLVRSCCVANQH